MKEDVNIREMVDGDIARSHGLWDAYSYDAEKMSALFFELHTLYMDEIEGFSKGLRVVQSYEDTAGQAAAYRANVEMLLARLEAFRDNGYRNEGLMDFYLQREHRELNPNVDFIDARMTLGMSDLLSAMEKEEIMKKLDEMEAICAGVMFKREKWDLLREYLVWLSGKDVDVAMEILPLFLKIS